MSASANATVGASPHPPASEAAAPSAAAQTWVKEFDAAYVAFSAARDAAFAVEGFPGHTPGEPEMEFALRIAAFYLAHRWENTPADVALSNARRLGRKALFPLVEDATGFANALAQGAFKGRHWSQALNIYMFTAPLDAANWLKMKAADHHDAAVPSWATVAALNHAASDPHVQVLALFSRVYKTDAYALTSSMNDIAYGLGGALLGSLAGRPSYIPEAKYVPAADYIAAAKKALE